MWTHGGLLDHGASMPIAVHPAPPRDTSTILHLTGAADQLGVFEDVARHAKLQFMPDPAMVTHLYVTHGYI